MKKTGILLIAIPVLLMSMFFVTAFVGVIYVMISKDSEMRAESRKQTVETVGTITDYSEITDVTANSVSTFSKLSFEFVVGGVSYSATDSRNASKSDIGKQGKVCYEPANPRNASFSFNKDEKCGQ